MLSLSETMCLSDWLLVFYLQLFQEAFTDLTHTDAMPMNFQEPTGLWQTQQLEVNV